MDPVMVKFKGAQSDQVWNGLDRETHIVGMYCT